ncbi:uncharacterized protein LOC118197443 [Stegodyphus dumicola]|uniref:uncharacterized protein LOC118197443 n=1 Tax=Stegodyphus dumicola TaxID=202533 RepID=UPI0015AE228B|nr:uncharacterized protein LOC118197443 [Stegodyphus dumicola]
MLICLIFILVLKLQVQLAAASCKKILQLAIKNRENEKVSIEFELLKLVRFQESRISDMCKQFLLTCAEKANQEINLIKTKIESFENADHKAESELLEIIKSVVKAFMEDTKKQTDALKSGLEALTKKKMRTEIEESQFVAACSRQFRSQADLREKEITLINQELESFSSIKIDYEDVKNEIKVMVLIAEKLAAEAIQTRKKEIFNTQCELIGRLKIKVSDAIANCKDHFIQASKNRKNVLNEFECELEKLKEIRKKIRKYEKDVVCCF